MEHAVQKWSSLRIHQELLLHGWNRELSQIELPDIQQLLPTVQAASLGRLDRLNVHRAEPTRVVCEEDVQVVHRCVQQADSRMQVVSRKQRIRL